MREDPPPELAGLLGKDGAAAAPNANATANASNATNCANGSNASNGTNGTNCTGGGDHSNDPSWNWSWGGWYREP